MAIPNLVPRQPDPFIKVAADQEVAKFGHLRWLIGQINQFISTAAVNEWLYQRVSNLTADSVDPSNNPPKETLLGTPTLTGTWSKTAAAGGFRFTSTIPNVFLDPEKVYLTFAPCPQQPNDIFERIYVNSPTTIDIQVYLDGSPDDDALLLLQTVEIRVYP